MLVLATIQYAKFVLVSTTYPISTSTNFIPMAIKFVLVEIVLEETVLVGDPLYLEHQTITRLSQWPSIQCIILKIVGFQVYPLCSTPLTFHHVGHVCVCVCLNTHNFAHMLDVMQGRKHWEGRGAAAPPPLSVFCESVYHISTRGKRLCPPHY